MVKWRLFVERWEHGYLGFKVYDVNDDASLMDSIDEQLSKTPIPIRMTMSFIGNHATKEHHGNHS